MNCIPLALAFLTSPSFGHAQDDMSVVAKIRTEGLEHSQLPDTLSYLTDVIGPRLTASPAMKRANEWTRDRLASWGLSNAHLESWGKFGRGWQLNHFEAEVLAPVEFPLIAYPKAWSPGLRGTTAEVVLVDATDIDGLSKWKGKLKGKIVLTGAGRALPAHYVAQGKRYTDAELEEMGNAKADAPRRPRAAGSAPGPAGGPPPNMRAQVSFGAARLKFFLDEGAAAVVDQSRLDDGTLGVQQASVPAAPAPANVTTPPRRIVAWDPAVKKNIPQVTVSSEQYNRITRVLKTGQTVKMHLAIDCQFFDKDMDGYNTVAEIPGGDLKDQVVMIGGHMDSWHSGTGATDNGAGVATAMEAVRILKALNLPLRRTVRVALWSGEEEGLFGSHGYVAKHLATFPNDPGFFGPRPDVSTMIKGPEYDKVSAYYNLDNGSGKIRGIYLQSNEAVRELFAGWLKPFADLGATTVTIRNTGSTDHISFDSVGVPGFQFIQDPIEYDTRTHHTNQDVYDRIQEDDLRQAAVIMAAFLYWTANRDEMIPRKPMS